MIGEALEFIDDFVKLKHEISHSPFPNTENGVI